MNDIKLALSYDDVLLVPQHSQIESRSDINLSTQITPNVKLKLPLISINMTDVTGVEMAIKLGKLGGIGFLPRFVTPEDQAEMIKEVKKEKVLVGAAIGCRDGEIKRAKILSKAKPDILTVDVAHGAMQKAIDTTSKLKNLFNSKIDIVSGVVATYEGASALFKAGADSVRIGVGPGTICTTRVVTGVGVPQITAVLNSRKAAEEHKKTIMCDGGTSNSGDIMKGLAAGACSVIVGSQFAGVDEAPGELINKNGRLYKRYNASTSYTEKKNHINKLKNTTKKYLKNIEGVESIVPYKGSLSDVVKRMESDLRAGFSYCGSKTIQELHQKAQFVQITQAGMKESSHHNVIALVKNK